MIECGVTWAKLQKALNYDLSGIVGCLVSHEHKDHSKAVKDVAKAGIDVYCSRGTFFVLDEMGLDSERRIGVVKDKDIINLGPDFRIRVFDTKHDAAEPLGFVVKCDNEYLLFATDTSHIRQRFMSLFNIIAIECSYDKKILQHRVDTSDINETLAKRLLTSHMEKQTAIDYINKFCDLSKCREIHLLHTSGDNIDKAQTKAEFESKFYIETRIVESAKNIHNKSN